MATAYNSVFAVRYAYLNASGTSQTRKPLCAIRKPTFHGKETANSMMLLPSFNFIGKKENEIATQLSSNGN